MKQSLIDLDALRVAVLDADPPAGGWLQQAVSRRAALGLAGAGAAGVSPALRVAQSASLGTFTVSQSRHRVVFSLDDRPCWVIDCRRFDGNPRLSLTRTADALHLTLRDARYPGTPLLADLTLRLRRAGALRAYGWRMRLELALGGFVAEAPFERWLAGLVPLRSAARMAPQSCTLGIHATLALGGTAEATFSPDWLLNFEGRRIAEVRGVGAAALPADLLTLGLAPTDADDAAEPRTPIARRTLISMRRGAYAWTLPLPDASGAGWTLEAAPETFETIRLSLGESRAGMAGRTLIAEGGPGAAPSLTFRPHHALTTDAGQPFALGLGRAVYAMAFHPAGDEAVLMARYHEPQWLHVGGLAVELGAGIDTPPFELQTRGGVVEAIRCTPAALRLLAPLAGAVVEPLALRPGTHLAFVTSALRPAALTQPVQVHVADLPAPAVALFLANPVIAVLRPDDLLSLRFEFAGLTLAASSDGAPALRVEPAAHGSSIAVYFQGQNIAEEAFFTTVSGYPVAPGTPDSVSRGEAPHSPVRTRIAGESRLVFAVPPDADPIPYTLESLLDWQRFDQQVAATAQPANGGVTASIAPPTATQTAIEVPWRLILSPNSYAAWFHALGPVTRNGRTELWHTRLGVRLDARALASVNTPAGATGLYDGPYQYAPLDTPDGRRYTVSSVARTGESELDVAAPLRTVRAIWSPDYLPSTKLKGLNSPFRMSLTAEDRAEIVRLSADFTHLPALILNSKRPKGLPIIPHLQPPTGEAVAPRQAEGTGLATGSSDSRLLALPTLRPSLDRAAAPERDVAPTGTYIPLPIDVSRLMLSTLGAWIDVRGAWGTNPFALPLQEWRHRGTMGRDHYVRVVYRGYLFPFGHQASLVKITERKFYQEGGRHVAYLFQREFIIVRQPVKNYGASNLDDSQGTAFALNGPVAPVTGKKRSIDRWMPFKQVRITTVTTPDIDAPTRIPAVSGPDPADAFWPQIGGKDFLFHLIGQDIEGQKTEFTAPLAFVSYHNSLAFNALTMGVLASFYTKVPVYESRRTQPTYGQDVAFAPASRTGNTTLHAQEITFGVFVPAASVKLPEDQPRFFPIVAAAAVRIPALEALLHTGQAPRIRISDHFLTDGMGAANAGEVFAEIIDGKPAVTFGGNDPTGSGGTGTPGLVTPNLAITGLSRVLGPVGGDVAKVASGSFGDEKGAQAFIKSFFSDSAKILGAISLSDIIDTSSMDRLEGVFGALSLLQSLQNYPLAIAALAEPAFAAGAGPLAALSGPALAALRSQIASLQGQLTGLRDDLQALRTVLQALPSTLLTLGNSIADMDALLTDVRAAVAAGQALITELGGQQLGAAGGSLAALKPPVEKLPADLDALVRELGPLLHGVVPLPQLTNTAGSGASSLPKAIDTSFTWSPKIKKFGPFTPGDTLLTVTANVHAPLDGTPPSFKIQGVLGAFTLDLFDVIAVSFSGLSFTAVSGRKADVTAGDVKVAFEGSLAFVNDLTKVIPGGGFSDPPYLDVEPDHIEAGFTLDIPSLGVGIFSLQNISLGAAVIVPFIGSSPARLRFNFCTRENPFLLTVSLIGGGGFFAVGVGLDGLDMLEAAFEFGGNFALNLGVASGGVSIMAGIYFQVLKGDATTPDSTKLAGFVRISGAVEVLGLITVSVEFYMDLGYEKVGGHSNAYGDATLTVEVSVLFFSKSISLSVHREFAGSDPTIQDQIGTEAVWDDYISAFAG